LCPFTHVKVSNPTDGEGTGAGFSDFASEVPEREMKMGHVVITGILLYLYTTRMTAEGYAWNTEEKPQPQ
jgi:hypothetical protein